MKVLVCGDVNGEFSCLISRVSAVIKKTGSYDILFCVGEFFGKDKDVNKKLIDDYFKFPIPTFVLGPCNDEVTCCYPDINGGQLCTNVTYLGRKGLYSGSSSLTVAFLSGVEAKPGEKLSSNFDLTDIASLRSTIASDELFTGIDILLTSQWPTGITKYASKFPEEDKVNGSQLVSQLALFLKPRYHFSGLDNVSYERQPYRNHVILSESSQHVTRFIALASVGNPDKKKFLYAFNINPMKHVEQAELTKQPQDVTEAPFKFNLKIFDAKEVEKESSQYFYDSEAIKRGNVNMPRKRKFNNDGSGNANKKPAISPDSCWFCLANPKVEKHLVASVGEQCYLAIAKGGLSEDHVLIIPINHYQSTITADGDVLEEIEQYKESLREYYNSIKMCVVFYERNFKSSHLQLQAVPLPISCENNLERSITEFASSKQMELLELPQHSDLKQIITTNVPYFYVELSRRKKFYLKVKQDFTLNFGREMLCQPSLLNTIGRSDWKSCQLSRDEEERCCADFRKRFKSFDPFQ